MNRFSKEIAVWDLLAIEDRINNVKVPEQWLTDKEYYGKVVPATVECKKLTFQVCKKLYKENGLYPMLVLPTVECGIFLTYTKNNREMDVEVYNDLGIAAVVADEEKKKILYSEDIVDMNFDECLRVLSIPKLESLGEKV
jgi:hypothetical protein